MHVCGLYQGMISVYLKKSVLRSAILYINSRAITVSCDAEMQSAVRCNLAFL